MLRIKQIKRKIYKNIFITLTSHSLRNISKYNNFREHNISFQANAKASCFVIKFDHKSLKQNFQVNSIKLKTFLPLGCAVGRRRNKGYFEGARRTEEGERTHCVCVRHGKKR